ncbi:hypothetical protein NC652_018541 [Populus alba x Populus x berolinensis]|nr:hypothetical protein NC652_018541 [Populus alba x Populus x berolinensis]
MRGKGLKGFDGLHRIDILPLKIPQILLHFLFTLHLKRCKSLSEISAWMVVLNALSVIKLEKHTFASFSMSFNKAKNCGLAVQQNGGKLDMLILPSMSSRGGCQVLTNKEHHQVQSGQLCKMDKTIN